MRVAMQPDFVAFLCDHPTLFRERLQGMAWNEECRLDLVLVEKLQQTLNSNSSSKEPT